MAEKLDVNSNTLQVLEVISQAELDQFYESLVVEVRRRGGMCAITSEMACVNFGVATSTNDCDLLCKPNDVKMLFGGLAKCGFNTFRTCARISKGC